MRRKVSKNTCQNVFTGNFSEMPVSPRYHFLALLLILSPILVSCSGTGSISESRTLINPPTGPTADSTPPSAPTALTASGIGSTQVNLGWVAATDDRTLPSGLRYEICVATSVGGCSPFVVTYTTATAAVSYSLTSLNSLVAYYIHLRSRDAAGNTGASANVIATTLAAGNTNPSGFTPGAAIYAAT